MFNIKLVIIICLGALLISCSDDSSPTNSENNEPQLLKVITGTDSCRGIDSVEEEFFNEFGYCCVGRVLPFSIVSTNDSKFGGERYQFGNMTALEDGTFEDKGTFLWTTGEGIWEGEYSVIINIPVGVKGTCSGFGTGEYEGLSFDMKFDTPGDPRIFGQQGTFEGNLYQLPD